MEYPVKVNDKVAIPEGGYYTPEKAREYANKMLCLADEIEAEQKEERCENCNQILYTIHGHYFCARCGATNEVRKALAAMARLVNMKQRGLGIRIDQHQCDRGGCVMSKGFRIALKVWL